MIRPMTERTGTGTEQIVVCPFVAYDDERDFRASVPDHRHRCFAESQAAPRALAHQAAYCLSAGFAGCPTFADWAHREAAPVKDPPVRTLRDAPLAPRGADLSRPAAAPAEHAESPASRPAARADEWNAPPAWSPGAVPTLAAGAAPGLASSVPRPGPAEGIPAAHADVDQGVDQDELVAPWPDSGLSAAAGAPPYEAAGPDPVDDAPPFLAGRVASRDGADAARPIPPTRRAPVGYAPVAPSRERAERTTGRPDRRPAHDVATPSWEQPRRREDFGSLRTRSMPGPLPRVVVLGIVVLIAAVGLFAAPFLLRGLTGGGAGSGPTPAPTPSAVPSIAPSATPAPAPTATIYVVKSGDTMSKIAKLYGVTIEQIMKVNPQIKDPNRIAVGDQIVIPVAVPGGGAVTSAPSATP